MKICSLIPVELVQQVGLQFQTSSALKAGQISNLKPQIAMRLAFKMQLFKGFEEEYRKRHDEIWPELQSLLKENGISNYSIFLDETTNSLFGVMDVTDPTVLDKLPQQAVMQRWWKYMADIMESNPDNSPVSTPLKEVFYFT